MNDVARRIAEAVVSRFPRDRWRNGYIRSKIRSDPAYQAVFEAVATSDLPLWDAGCGMGLLAFYLRECGWLGGIVGTDLSEEKIMLARWVAERFYYGIDFGVRDVREPPEGFIGNVSLLDVVYYLQPREQANFFNLVDKVVPPGGVCVLRTALRDCTWRYAATVLEEWFIRGIGWIRGGAINFPRADEVIHGFPDSRWKVAFYPLWGRTPFNSYLFVCSKRTKAGYREPP